MKYLIAAAATLALLSGCSLVTDGLPILVGLQNAAGGQLAGHPAAQGGVVNPIIQALSPNPSSVAHKGDAITFTVVAFAPNGAVLDYTWAATKGNLSATKGQSVSWTPATTDGSVTPGTATVQVILSNGKGGIATASINLTIEADGSAAAGPVALPTPMTTVTGTPGPTAKPNPLAGILPQLPVSTTLPTPITGLLPSLTASPAATGNGANLVFDGYTFAPYKASIDGQTSDNGDQIIQHGETVVVIPAIKNIGTSRTDDVSVTAQMSASGAILTENKTSFVGGLPGGGFGTVSGGSVNGGVTFGNFDSGQSTSSVTALGAWASTALAEGDVPGWKLQVSKDCPPGTVLNPVLTAQDKYGNSWKIPFTITIQ